MSMLTRSARRELTGAFCNKIKVYDCTKILSMLKVYCCELEKKSTELNRSYAHVLD